MGNDDLWVFAYGSLMWQPGFDYVECRPAVLHGYHRAMCILSTHYRGCPDRPGLVLGLDRGGSCRGLAFRVPAGQAAAVQETLYRREMVTEVYRPGFLAVRLDDGRKLPAWGFVVRRDHPQYVGAVQPGHAVALIRQGQGQAGTSRDYLAATVGHLDALGIRDGAMHRLLAAVDGPADGPARVG